MTDMIGSYFPVPKPRCLAQREVVPYLLRHKLISLESIVQGDLAVVDSSRRNHNFKVINGNGPSYLLKQGVDPGRIATVAREGTVYQLLFSDAGNDGVHRYLPHFYGYDAEEHILILEFLRNAQDLRGYYVRRGPFFTAPAVALGNALGILHHTRQIGGKRVEDIQGLAHKLPSVLSLHHPNLSIFRDISNANLQIIHMIQQFPEFCELLDSLRREWRTQTLIHFDIRWDNCLVSAHSATRRKIELKLVDWELAGVGDPCWDVGSVFNDYLSCWLLSIPITGETPPDRFPELARYPLHKMQPALRSFWRSYVRRMELDTAASEEWLLRAVKYAAARLVQTAFEHMQMAVQRTSDVVCLLQISLNMLRRPQEAMVHLLGIPLQEMSRP